MIGDHHQQQQPSKHIELDKSFHLVPHLPASYQDCIIHSFDVLSADVITSIIARHGRDLIWKATFSIHILGSFSQLSRMVSVKRNIGL